MKQIVKFSLIVVLIMVAHHQTQAQELQTRAKEKVLQLIDYIEHIVKNTESPSSRQNYIRAALNLFIGNGGPYYSFEVGDTLEGVIMETKIIRDKNQPPRIRLMKKYFADLSVLDKWLYTEVIIKGTLVNRESLDDPLELKISPMKAIRKDTLYQCTISFGQFFDAKQGEDYVYRDFTKKNISVFFSLVPINTTSKLIPFLGDVYVADVMQRENNE